MKFRVRNETRATLLGDSIDVADSGPERNRGLLKRTGLLPGEGLWIVPCEGIHTFFMKFNLDIVYIDRKKRVRKVLRNMGPWKLSLCLPAHSVLELPVGVIADSGTAKGDQLVFEKVQP